VRFPQTTDSTRTYPISRQLGNINPLLDLVQPDLILNQTRHVGEATLLWQQLHLHRRTLQILNANTIRSDRLQQVIGQAPAIELQTGQNVLLVDAPQEIALASQLRLLAPVSNLIEIKLIELNLEKKN
jgi:hypothetical protein